MWLLRNGFVGTVLAWITQLPETLLYGDALLCSVCALTYLLARQFDRATAFVAAGKLLTDTYTPVVVYGEEHPISRQELDAHFTRYQALLAQAAGQSEEVIALAQQALVQLPAHTTALRSLLYFIIGTTQYGHGAIDLAQAALRESVNHARQLHQNTFIATSALSVLGTIFQEQGDLTEAMTVFQGSIAAGTHDVTGAFFPPVIYPSLNLAWLYYRWNDWSTS